MRRFSAYESKTHKKSNCLILASESKSDFDPLARNSRFDILWNFDPYDEKFSNILRKWIKMFFPGIFVNQKQHYYRMHLVAN